MSPPPASALFLPPAPHSGAFFDKMRAQLSGIATATADYPGYGDAPPVSSPSIELYAASLLPQARDTPLIGFHTGCLVALEMARQQPSLGPLTLIDIPFFSADVKAKYAAGLEPDNPAHDAFRAAFAYNAGGALKRCAHPAAIIATRSALFEPTLNAAALMPHARLLRRRDIEKPAFESAALAELLRDILEGSTGDLRPNP